MQPLEAIFSKKEPLDWPFQQAHTNWTVSIVVLFLHLLALALITFVSHRTCPPKVIKKIAVRTVSLQPKSAKTQISPQIALQAPTHRPAQTKQPEPKAVDLPAQSDPEPIQEVVAVSAPVEMKAVEAYEPPIEAPTEVSEPVTKTIEEPVASGAKTAPEKIPAKAVTKPLDKPKAKAQATTAKPDVKKTAKTPPKPAAHQNAKKPQSPPKVVTKAAPKPAAKPAPKKATASPQATKSSANNDAANKAAAQKKAAKEREVANQRALEQKQNAMIAQALSSLDSAGGAEGKKSSLQSQGTKYSGSAPAQISTLASESLVSIDGGQEADFTPQERTYYDELISRLKLSLKLPEYGQVKLQLCISRQGSVVRVSSVVCKSTKNKDYIQKSIPKIHFPPFGQNFSGEKEHTFRLTLSNELNY